MKSVVVTGYKSFELGIFKKDAEEARFIKEALRRELLTLVDEGLEWVIISGLLGTELWAGEVVSELKWQGYAVKLAVLEPFEGQTGNWNEANQLWASEVLQDADYHAFITKRPYESPRQFEVRDQFLIDHTEGAILIYDLEKEGSPRFFYERAKQAAEMGDYELRLIDFYRLQEVVEEINEWGTDE
ncbi:DUF1273 domain-containing protein [Listeria costaricensis]|uniref:DUF1273 domain-containing protein n=1 Tax=Listeria costaricensis TaxID=2026604 RepID=UPI000C0814F3|nr:DUF1273 domain-containing protein [Listeria costaricensis]